MHIRLPGNPIPLLMQSAMASGSLSFNLSASQGRNGRVASCGESLSAASESEMAVSKIRHLQIRCSQVPLIRCHRAANDCRFELGDRSIAVTSTATN